METPWDLVASGREIRAGNFLSANAANYRRQLRRRPRSAPGHGDPRIPGAAPSSRDLPAPESAWHGGVWSAQIHDPDNPGGWVLSGERHWECDFGFAGEGKIERRGGSRCHGAFGCRASTSLGTPSLSW